MDRLSFAAMFANTRNHLFFGGTYTNYQGDAHGRELDVLQHAACPDALYDSGHEEDPPRCLPGTRETVQEKIMDWTEANVQSLSSSENSVMWVKGSAGVGKTAIAHTIAEHCASQGTLLASYFFSRSRRDVRSLVATLVYQIILNIPETLDIVAAVIKKDPLIFRLPLDTQFRALIMDPLQSLIESGCDNYSAPGFHHVIILDGLDECQDATSQVNILRTFTNLLPQCPLYIRLLVTSRPEQHIMAFFEAPEMDSTVIQLDINNEDSSYNDIFAYFNVHFDEVRTTHPIRKHIPFDWPCSSLVYALARRASGQFIYASTVVKYLASPYHNPVDRLNEILNLGPRSKITNPLAGVDALYQDIISRIHYPWPEVRKILTPILFYPGICLEELEAFFRYKPGDIQLRLSDLSSVVSIAEDEHGFSHGRIFHASFPDFLLDHSRSEDLCISKPQDHTAIVSRCFEVIKAREPYLFRLSLFLLAEHLPYADLNVKVQEDILSFAFPGFRFLHDTGSVEAYFSYLDRLPSTFQPRVQLDVDLRRDRKKQFAGYLNEQLAEYYKDPGLTSLVVMVVHSVSLHTALIGCSYSVAQLDKSAAAFDQQSLMLCDLVRDMTVPSAQRHSSVIRDRFVKLQESGSEARTYNRTAHLKCEHYASATLVACKYLKSHVDQFHQDIKESDQVETFGLPIPQREWKKEIFVHALDLLAFTVPLGSWAHSEEGVQLMREVKTILGMDGLDRGFPFYVKNARDVLWNYLGRSWW